MQNRLRRLFRTAVPVTAPTREELRAARVQEWRVRFGAPGIRLIDEQRDMEALVEETPPEPREALPA